MKERYEIRPCNNGYVIYDYKYYEFIGKPVSELNVITEIYITMFKGIRLWK